ncbi:hypothetical protein DPMN_128298 [Dreissena polymorpha]|uniref:Uncharacterized protein n=1 Tax=Dreissena polymorpha TaxID=45954 RepID=A0A9D4H3M3_DREPO|nr:hypothetical protein DPMN_128298 [Dreissena polymorpha]
MPTPWWPCFSITQNHLELVNDIYGKILLIKFHDDWTMNVASRVNKRYIIGTNLLTKFHEDLTINVATRVLTRQMLMTDDTQNKRAKMALVRSLERNIDQTNILVNNFDKECLRNVNSRVFTNQMWMDRQWTKTNPKTSPEQSDWALYVTSTVFELDRDIIGTNLLTKFHEDRTINVASRVFTNKCGRTDNGRTMDKHRSQKLP